MNQPAKRAMNRYLKDLERVLATVPKEVRTEALRDAEEFLSSEIDALGTELTNASELQTFERLTERFGSPNQVATEYLQGMPSAPQGKGASGRWRALALSMLLLIITVGAICSPKFFEQPSRQQEGALTSDELQLVGHWLVDTWQDDDPGVGYAFHLDRTFDANRRQFFGQWQITDGKLYVQYTSERNWGGNSWLEKLANGIQAQPVNSHQLDIEFGDDGRTVRLVEVSSGDVTKLMRPRQ